MGNPLVSIVSPNYNHGHYLADMIESCLDQSYANWELIIVDDASTDNSVEIARSYTEKHSNIRLLCNKTNQGAIVSVNLGLREAKGDYVLMRSADDINLPQYFETGVKLLSEHPEAAFFCGDIAYFRDELALGQRETLGIGAHPGYYSPKQLEQTLGVTPIHGHTVMIRRGLMLESDFFQVSHAWYNDWLPYMTWAFRSGVCYSPNAFVASRLLAGSFCGKNASQTEKQNAVVGQILCDLIDKHSELLNSFIASGALGFFGNALWRAIESKPSLQKIFEPRISEIKSTIDAKSSRQNGIRRVISQTLEINHERLKAHLESNKQVWIYGAGFHTDLLLGEWNTLRLKNPTGIILTTGAPEILFNLPARNLESVKLPEGAMIIVSSKSYEEDIISLCQIHFPQAELLTFWT